MTHGSLFSGIGGFDLGFESAGMRSIWQVEKEPFCLAVLKTKFPHAEKFEDVRLCGRANLRTVDVISGGFPCQDLSVAGKRAGLGGARSGLFWEVVRILGELRPAWFVLENVPGLFSSGEGRDFAIVLNALDELGYGLAWRVLNSQFFGVAQRRRRVFIVGRFGKPCPAEVLFESEGGGGDFAESGEAGENLAGSLGGGAYGSGRRSEDDPNLAYCLREDPGGIGQGHNTTFVTSSGERARAITGSSYKRHDEDTDTLIAIQDARGQRDKRKNGIGIQEGGPMYTLDGTWQHAVASTINSGGNAGGFRTEPGEHLVSAPANSDRVRDFAELPQGMDSARYGALGNAVTASVAEWIGKRILSIHGS